VAHFATEVRDGRLQVSRDAAGPVTAIVRGDAATIAGVLKGRFHPARVVERGRLQCTNLDALREKFRPFAPSVLREDASTYFECEVESPYMILVAQVQERWQEILKSVTHRDGSARIQTATPDWNPRYYDLLAACKRLTGLPVLLNTSFNRKGMPIVETPEEAIHFSREADGLDAFVIEDF